LTDTIATSPDTIIDPVTGAKAWTHELTGRHYVPQSLRGYLLGRALDIIIVAAATFALAKGAEALLQSTALMAQEWQSVAVVGLILFSVTFLYGGIAGTVGTVGETVTRMRVVNIDDGSVAGFLAGGLRAVGWFLYVLFTLALSSSGAAETRYVAVRRNALKPHTNKS
jgi:hypothetical protein